MSSAVSILDVAPTVLELAGLPEPARLHGQSLSATILGRSAPQRWLLAQRRHYDESVRAKRHRFAGRSSLHAVRGDSRFKYLRSGDGEEELFDLHADPRETTNLATEQPAELLRMRERFEALRQERAGGEAPRERAIDPGTREALEALGYVQ